jgi:hypothetical protein
VAVSTVALLLASRASAWAQPVDRADEKIESQAPRPAQPEEPPPPPGEPPRAQTGFQLAFRTGASFPVGRISAEQSTSDVFGWQVPFLFEIGGKPLPWLFVGGYAGAAFGGVAPAYDRACSGAGVSCSSRSERVGIEALVYFQPGSTLDPWIGYGIGYESSSAIGEANKSVVTQSVSGLELAHFMAGLDLRVSHSVGFGPFLDVGFGRFGSFHHDPTAAAGSVDGDIQNTAFHEWISVGARIVAFP